MTIIEQLICHLCAGSSEIERYTIKLSEQERKYLNKSNDLLKTDICIGKEIKALIRSGIKTKGCCCGHGKDMPCCLVDKLEKKKLDKLGYTYKNYDDTDMFEIELKTDVQIELRKVIGGKVFNYLANN